MTYISRRLSLENNLLESWIFFDTQQKAELVLQVR